MKKREYNGQQLSVAEVMKATFQKREAGGRARLTAPITVDGQSFPLGAVVFFLSDSNGAMKSESTRKAERHWNQAIVYLGDASGSLVRFHVPKEASASDDAYETELRLRGEARRAALAS